MMSGFEITVFYYRGFKTHYSAVERSVWVRIKGGMIRFCGRAKARPLESIILKFYGFKSISFRCRDGCMIKDTVVMLSECPNVRVHNVCPAREFGAH